MTIPSVQPQFRDLEDTKTKETQNMQLEPTKFIDKNGVEIKGGDLLYIEHVYENRQFRDRETFIRMEDGHIVSHYDEGDVISKSLEWVTYRVEWWGACMVAERENYSSLGRYTNKRELPINERVIYLNACFEPELFEVLQETSDLYNSVSLVTTQGGEGY